MILQTSETRTPLHHSIENIMAGGIFSLPFIIYRLFIYCNLTPTNIVGKAFRGGGFRVELQCIWNEYICMEHLCVRHHHRTSNPVPLPVTRSTHSGIIVASFFFSLSLHSFAIMYCDMMSRIEIEYLCQTEKKIYSKCYVMINCVIITLAGCFSAAIFTLLL